MTQAPGAGDVDTILAHAREVVRHEAEALAGLADQIDESFVRVVGRVLATPGKVVTTGSGTSGIMAERLAHLLSVTGTPAFYLPCLDALHGGMAAVTPDDLVIALSKGGQSRELTELAVRLAERGVDVVAVTERAGSPFAAAASLVVTVTTAPEDADLGGLVATGSTLVVGAWGDALAAVLMQRRGYSWSDVVSSHPGGLVGQASPRPGGPVIAPDVDTRTDGATP